MRLRPLAGLVLALFPGRGVTAATPLMREFMGINGHTVQFRPALYAPACALVRDYHPVEWDLGEDTGVLPPFPEAKNRVNWRQVYGSWHGAGFTTDVCLMFDGIGATRWRDPEADPRRYGEAFARAFGPSSATPLVTSVEMGNEPGRYSDAAYRRTFAAMAAGVRAGDSRMTLLPCALSMTASGDFSRGIACLDGLDALYDALNLHVYAFAALWPTWRRSYPEDPAIPYLGEVRAALAWRDAHAPTKPVWVTEFGWDASTRKPPATGEGSAWIGVTDTRQAQFLVRSFLMFARMGIARAYIYFFNDEDQPSLHAASGLTRRFVPKPSFHAVSHLLATLGDYRFETVLEETPGRVYAYRFVHGTDPTRAAVVAWSPTATNRTGTFDLPVAGERILRVTTMPLTGRPATAPRIRAHGRLATIPISESPVYLLLQRR